MNISAPDSTSIPEKEQKALEAARNNVTILEAEQKRLIGINKDLNGQMIDVLNKTADYKAEMEKTVGLKTQAESDLKEVQTELEKVTAEMEDTKSMTNQMILTSNKAVTDAHAKIDELMVTRSTVSAESNKLVTDRAAFEAEKSKHLERVNKLNTVLSNL